jgi:hypothetical protein
MHPFFSTLSEAISNYGFFARTFIFFMPARRPWTDFVIDCLMIPIGLVFGTIFFFAAILLACIFHLTGQEETMAKW